MREGEASVAKVLALVRAWPESWATVTAIEAAVAAAGRGAGSRARVAELGRGWVGEQALAIGLYCAIVARTFAECWSSQVSVDTSPPRLVSRLEPVGTHSAKVAVAAYRIVEGLDVVGYVRDRELAAKLKVLETLKARGVWLMDASPVALYAASQPKPRVAELATALEIAWPTYTREAIRAAAPRAVMIVGKMVHDGIGGRIRAMLGPSVPVQWM